MGWAFWLAQGADPNDALMLRIAKEIDDSELWGRTPTILGTLRRGGYNVVAKKTKDHPRLWSNLLELALRARRPCEGAIVGGGTRGFPAVTGEPGVLWLVFWPYRRPTALRTYELRSHWGVSMEKLAGPEWEDTAFFGIYSTLERLEETGDDDVVGKRSPTGNLPKIPEEQYQELGKHGNPRSRHEQGEWLPEEPVRDPFE